MKHQQPTLDDTINDFLMRLQGCNLTIAQHDKVRRAIDLRCRPVPPKGGYIEYIDKTVTVHLGGPWAPATGGIVDWKPTKRIGE